MNLEVFKNKKHLLAILIPLVIGGIFLMLCLSNMTRAIWYDEGYSAYIIRGNFKDIWKMTAVDVHPPFYYFALKIWSLFFGTSDVALRFMSVFFGLVTLVFIFQLVKRLFGMKASTVATFLTAISPMFVRYAQEMRMYTMVAMIIVMATYFLMLALEKIEKRYWIVYAILVATGMWTHYFSALAWIAHVIIILVYCWFDEQSKEKRINLIKRAVGYYLFSVVLFLPWMKTALFQFGGIQGGFWIPKVNIITPINFILEAFYFTDSTRIENWMYGIILLLLVLTVMIVQVCKKEKIKILSIIIMIFVPMILLILLSLPPFKPVFMNRYILYSVIFIPVLIGVLITNSKKIAINLIVLAFVIFSFGKGNILVKKSQNNTDLRTLISEIKYNKNESAEAVLVWNCQKYFEAIPYTSDNYRISTILDENCQKWGAMETIRNYKINTYDDIQDFLLKNQKFWYIGDRPININDGLETRTFKGLKIKNEISIGNYTAVELSKE